MQWKKIEVAALVQELKSIVPVYTVFLLKSNTVFSECVRLFAWFLCAAQDAQCNTEESPLDW